MPIFLHNFFQKASTANKYVRLLYGKDRMSFHSAVQNWRLFVWCWGWTSKSMYAISPLLQGAPLSLFFSMNGNWFSNNWPQILVSSIVGIFALCFRFIQTAYRFPDVKICSPLNVWKSRYATLALLFLIEHKQYNLSMIITSNLIMRAQNDINLLR